MEYRKIGDYTLSRFGLGTKRMPITDASRVDRLDREIAAEIANEALNQGMNYFDTSYSNHKGEAESFLGDYHEAHSSDTCLIATSFFELVDPRYTYVFQKQLKKLRTDKIDFYSLEGVCDLNKMRDIDSGAVDFLFEQREAGHIGCLGFSSELSPDNLRDFIGRYPWDFVRMRVNYYDWFNKDGSARYDVAKEFNLPIIAHAALRTGAASALKPEALSILKDANPDRSSVDWALRFVKSLDGIVSVTCNMHSVREVKENSSIFNDTATLSPDELNVLEACAKAQREA
ncbi:aldo/keto reductase [Ellagibacter isourolithinifaciens]|uniref:aldo/keto reductase n=1 Tax=Ellagibacter isourolithinifaciens TaxID=2137581 RepID=UPI003A9501AA